MRRPHADAGALERAITPRRRVPRRNLDFERESARMRAAYETYQAA